MKLLFKLGIILALAVSASIASAGELVDRLVASVENVPILQSDWDHAVALEALEQGRTTESMSPVERRSVLEHLVDQQLLRLQMGDENIAAAEERDVARQLEAIRAAYSQVKSDEDWQRVLASYGLDQDRLHRDVARQLQVLRFVDLRLRPASHVEKEEIQAYYQETFVPEVQRRGGKEQDLAEVYPQIEEILRQQRIDVLLNSWLQDLRGQSNIQWLAADEHAAEGDDVATSGGR